MRLGLASLSRSLVSFALLAACLVLASCLDSTTSLSPAAAALATPSPTPASSATPVPTPSASLVSTSSVSGYTMQKVRVSLAGQRDAYVAVFPAPSNCTGARATVLMTKPYDGFAWSSDAIDLKWSQNPNAANGYMANDDNSIGYDPASGGQIAYSITADASLFGDAYYYLLHCMNVAFVFNRFYAGSTFAEHALDTSLALKYLRTLPNVDSTRIGVYGISWGGMTAALGAAAAGGSVASLVLLSPALNLPAIDDHFLNWVPNHVVSSSQRAMFAGFYSPYGRRIDPLLSAPPPAVTPFLTASSIATRLALAAGHTLVMGDEWDTLVPHQSTLDVVNAMPASSVTGLWWTHAQPLDYETAPLGHNVDTNEPLSFSVVMTVTQLEFTQALLDPSQPVTVLIYNMNEWWAYLAYMKAQQALGRDMSALTRVLIQMASPQVTVMNQNDNTQVGSGADFVSIFVNTTWNVNIPSAQIRANLQANGLPH